MNLTNVFIDILRSAMTQTSCDMIEGLSTQDWEKIYDISQKQQLAPMIYQQIFSEISETSSSGINLQRTTASSRRTAGLCRIGINECRELWLTYKRYLYICYQYHHLPDCFYRNEKI